MRPFLDKDFLLATETAKVLYHDYAAAMPIIDYHCHIDPQEIARDRRYENIAQLWLGGDHYKWRLLRANGEDERIVTGDGSDYEKFLAFARALPRAIGNPVYHWAHLELQRYFDCHVPLSPETADDIWHSCNAKLTSDDFSARNLITRSRVEMLATTDDPLSPLEWHAAIAEDASFATKVLPTFRPDKAIQIDKPEFLSYLKQLAETAKTPIRTLDDLFSALESRIDYFDKMGCRASDHGLDYIPYQPHSETKAPAIFSKALNSEPLSADEADAYKTALLVFLGRAYARRGWAMQLHYGVQRNINTAAFKRLGPDTGFDVISTRECSRNVMLLLDALEQTNELPRTILYSLNPADDAMLDAVAGSFPQSGIAGKVQHGSAWWYNDTRQGMEAQLASLASRGVLGGFVGMLTDSRSFLSYPRHEYFRRILCNLLGTWVENGEHPRDFPALGTLVQDISYRNVARYFRLENQAAKQS